MFPGGDVREVAVLMTGGWLPTGRRLLSFLALHAWLTACLYMVVRTVWGNLAEKTYAARMRPGLRGWLMPGRFAEKPYWIRSQKIAAALTLPVVLVVYAGIMAELLR